MYVFRHQQLTDARFGGFVPRSGVIWSYLFSPGLPVDSLCNNKLNNVGQW